MSRLRDLDQQFRDLHKESVKTFEEEIKREQELFEKQKPKEREDEQLKLIREFLPDLDKLTKRDEADLNKSLQETRPKLIERPSHAAMDAQRLSLSPGSQIPSLKTVHVYTSSLMAGDKATLEGIEGERGNPWVLPWNPGRIKIKDARQDFSVGLCGWARPYVPPVIADVWFAFIPDTTAMWSLLGLVNFHGFYYLQAHKDWWNCRDSRVRVDVEMDVYQYFWNGLKRFPLLNIESENGVKYGFYDDYQQFDYKALLRADPQYYAFAKIRIIISATVYGGGAYAELNFADGAANYIEPLVVFAGPF